MGGIIADFTKFLGSEAKSALKKYNHKLSLIVKKKFKNENYIYCDLENIKRQ